MRKNGSVITNDQYEQNNHSYSQFLKGSLSRNKKQKEEVVLITDGAYSGKENRGLAAEKNIRLVTTDLSGKPVNDILAQSIPSYVIDIDSFFPYNIGVTIL